MALQPAADVTQSLEFLLREEAAERQRGIEPGRCVTFGKDETVACFAVRVGRVDVKLPEIQISKHVGGGQTAARMAGFGRMSRCDDPFAQLAGSDLQAFFLVFGHVISPSDLKGIGREPDPCQLF